MKQHSPTPSATSLPRAPRDDSSRRMTKYFIMMAVRVLCFILMAVVTPYGWHTALFAVGAVFLPYLAVVVANVGDDLHEPDAVSPRAALSAERTPRPAAAPVSSDGPRIIEVRETPPPVIEVRETRPE